MSGFFLSQTPPTSSLWPVYVLGTVTVVYAVFIRPMMRQKKDPLAKRPAIGGSLSQQRAVERQMEALLVELSDMARQITAQLDTRAGKLEALLKEADEKIAAMKAALPLAGSPPFTSAPMASPPSASSSVPASPDPVEPRGDAPAPNGIDPRHVPIYELADAGFSARDIANELKRPSGEVELILALRARR